MKPKQPFIIIPLYLLQVKKIRLTAKIVYRYLVWKAGASGYWEGWINQIVQSVGIPYRTVQRDLGQLAAVGYIKIDQHFRRHSDGKLRTYTKYIINQPEANLACLPTSKEE